MRAAFACLLLACAGSARALEAAASKVDITPDFKSESVYLAGYGSRGRRPSGVHDPLYARLVLLRAGGKTVALVGLDLLGFYRNDVRRLRAAWGKGDENRVVFVHATHTHAGPDTLGLWGPWIGKSGVDPRYLERVGGLIAAELSRLEGRLEPVAAVGGGGRLDPRGLCRDLRDPQVIDPNLAVLRLRAAGGRDAAVLVNWSCHPEVLGRTNMLVSADYPGPLCARIERETGGACLFLNGMIGGLMSPDAKSETFEESERIGSEVARAALALKTPSRGGILSYRAETVRVPVENSRYLLFLGALSRGHDVYGPAGQRLGPWAVRGLALRHLLFGLKPEQRPWVETEVSVLDVGPARLLGMPAEVFPELGIGGYAGEYAFGRHVVGLDGPPRDLISAPKPPYLRDLIKAPVPMIVGLANDELGYLVPEYDFQVRPSKSMLPRLPGHYEETNSIGPSATKILVDAAARLLAAPN